MDRSRYNIRSPMPSKPANTTKAPRRGSANSPKTRDGLLLPQLPRLSPVEALPGGQIQSGAHYSALALTGGHYTAQEGQRVFFEQVHLKRVNLSRTRLPEAQWSDARLEGCDLSGVDWEKARLRRVEVI